MSLRTFDYAYLGRILKEARENAGFTQNDIATELGVKYQTVSAWETGKNKIDIDTLIVLCNKYGLSLSGLLTDATEQKKAPTGEDPAEALIAAMAAKLGRLPTVEEMQSLGDIFDNLCKLMDCKGK